MGKLRDVFFLRGSICWVKPPHVHSYKCCAKMEMEVKISPALTSLMRRPIERNIGVYIPHSVHPTCKLKNFLNLRAVARTASLPMLCQIAQRVVILLRHSSQEVVKAVQKIKESGFLLQCWYPGRPLWKLRIVPQTGLPKGMTRTYLQKRQSELKYTGWTNDGGLEL